MYKKQLEPVGIHEVLHKLRAFVFGIIADLIDKTAYYDLVFVQLNFLVAVLQYDHSGSRNVFLYAGMTIDMIRPFMVSHHIINGGDLSQL